jgi:predicted RNA-binding protein with PIN domain
MKFLIDAYNVIGQLDHISLSDPQKVPKFIDWITRHQKKGMQAILVFDGQNELIGFPTTEKRPGLTIVHTSGQRSADAYIKNKIDGMSDVSNIMVVTSDNDIIRHIKKKKVKVMQAASFIIWLLEKNDEDPAKKSPIINQRHVDYWLNEFGH